MNLKEYQGKELFKEFGIKAPTGFVIEKGGEIPVDIEKLGEKVTVKAQVAKGKRGKAGAIAFVENKPEIVRQEVERIFDMELGGLPVKEILVEDFVETKKLMYLAITLDRLERCPVVVFCEEGGVDIEETAEKDPDKIKKFEIRNSNHRRGRAPALAGEIENIKSKLPESIRPAVEKMYKLFVEKDCSLVEINPIAELADGSYMALDSKVVIDNNALFRHEELLKFKTDDYTELEKEAKENDLSYVELDGDIAVIGNGAGLVMATLDTLAHFGGEVANFLDVGGGANAAQMKKALTIALKKDGVRKIFINIFGGITRADEIAQGLVDFKKENGLNIPVVLRVVGTHEKEAKKILTAAKIEFSDDMEGAASKVVSHK